MKRKRSRIFAVLMGLLLIPLLLLALLQTPPGREWLASLLERKLGGAENLEVRIGTISGWIPARMEIDRLEIGDNEGIWLTVEDLRARWIMRDLLHHRIRLARIGARTIDLHRFPAAGESARRSAADGLTFRPVEVVLDQLVIGHLKLGEAVAGMPLEYGVRSGGIRLLPSGRLTGALRIDGDAVGGIELDASLGGRQENRLDIRAELEQLKKPSFGQDRLTGHAEASVTRTGVHGRVSASLSVNDREGECSAGFTYADQRLSVQDVRIATGGYAAEGDIQAEFSDEKIDILVDAKMENASAHSGALHAAATYSRSNANWTVELHPLELRYRGQIGASLSGTVSSDRLAVEGSLEAFDLNDLPVAALANYTGEVGGRVSLSGSPAKPEIRAELDVRRFTSTDEVLDKLPEGDFRVSGTLANGTLQGSTVISNFVNGRIAAGFGMPFAFSLDPWMFEPDIAGIRADLTADADLGFINQLPLLTDQRLAGRLTADLVYDHGLSGSVRVEQGMYEHYAAGIVVRDLSFDLAAVEGGVEVRSATATDGGDGRIEMKGGVVSGKIDLSLDLDGANIIRRDDMEGTLSGQLAITGSLARPAVTGLLTVDRADILIEHITPSLPPLLTDYDASAATETNTVKKGLTLPFDLDVQIDLADQVFANASMIDSVWGGKLRVKNMPQGIGVSGVITPRRGFVSFIGKKFRFTDGWIDLDGAVPTMPVMNQLTAEYSRGDFTARLILNGRLDNPDYRLESTPAMPESEVLSQVLFNRDTSSISPFQAIQIAAAARQLSGGIGGPGFMYQMRQAVGVDTLEWREGDTADSASTVAAGKYLTPELYVEINRSFDENGGTGVMAEYDVTRYFSVETSTGPKMRPGIGVNVKFTY